MAKYASMVKETTTTTGTGNLTLAGAVTGFRALSDVFTPDTDIYDADYVGYFIMASDGTWERGYGQFYDATTLKRSFVMESTNDDAAIYLPVGEHTISIAPNPDMGQPRGFFVYDPTQINVANIIPTNLEFALAKYDTDNLYTLPETHFNIPLWVDKIKVSGQIYWSGPSDLTGYRDVSIIVYSTSTIGNPALRIPVTTDLDNGRHYISSGLIDIRHIGNFRNVYMRAYQNTGVTNTFVGSSTWMQCEFAQ